MRLSTWILALSLLLLLAACGSTQPPPPPPPPPPTTGAISGVLVYPGSTGTGGALEGASLAPAVADLIPLDAEAAANAAVVPGEVIVFFEEGSSGALSTMSVEGSELTAVRDVGPVGRGRAQLMRAPGLDQRATLELAREIAARPGVVAAYPNWILEAFKAPDDEYYPRQWHYPAMNLPAAWDIEDGTTNPVTVAVVDSGSFPHPDLVWHGGYDFVSDSSKSGDGDGRDPDPTDEGGDSEYHGTHVAGTVAARTNNGVGVAGVSWGARLVPVRALGTTGVGTTLDIMDAVRWAAGRSVTGVPANPDPARVINLSLGGDIGVRCPSQYEQIFSELANDGIIVVVAAGNQNRNAATTFPANCTSVITVGATGPDGTRAPYSNFGTTIDVMATGGDVTKSVEVGGVTVPAGVLSTVAKEEGGTLVPGYAFYPGTSMAAPHISGIAALMLSLDPGLSFVDVRDRLKLAATPLTAAECGRPSTAECGQGLVDAAKALLSNGTPPPPPPPPPPTENLVTYVAALRCTPGCIGIDTRRSKLVEVEVISNEVPFDILGLEPGTYIAAAWQDLNNDGEVTPGEPFGVYTVNGEEQHVTVRAGDHYTDVVIVMEPYALGGAGSELPAAFSELAH